MRRARASGRRSRSPRRAHALRLVAPRRRPREGRGRRPSRAPRLSAHRLRAPRQARVRRTHARSAPAVPFLNRVDQASRTWIAASRAGRDFASSSASASRSQAWSTLPRSASSMRASARTGPMSPSSSSSAAIVRARVHSPAACSARAVASALRARSLASAGGRQPERVLGELRGDGCRASLARRPHGLVEDGSHSLVRPVGREREVSGPHERVGDDARNPGVHAPPLAAAEVRVEDGCKQRVAEANRVLLADDHLRGSRLIERLLRDARLLEQRLGRRAERRCQRECLAARRREPFEPRPHERLERVRNRQRRDRVDVRPERARQLQREEWVAARPFVDAEQRLARERPAHPVAHEAVHRADAERLDREPPNPLGGERTFELGRLRRRPGPAREQHRQPGRRQPAQRERECARGRGVEPLHIVDGEQRRLAVAERIERVPDRDGERPWVDALAQLAQERDLERAAPRRLECGQRVVQNALQQIARGPRRRARARPRPAGPRARACRAPAPPRLRRATVSTCRYPLRLPGRRRPGPARQSRRGTHRSGAAPRRGRRSPRSRVPASSFRSR